MPLSQINSASIEDSSIATGDIANSAVTSAKMDTLVQPLGVGQTWQTLTGSRAIGTTYTNSTGRPIFVSILVNPANTSSSATLTINSVPVAYAQGFVSLAIGINIYGIVPSGGTYVVTTTGTTTMSVWAELR
jgi:hypothetical protein